MAKPKVKKKSRGVKKNVPHGVANVHASFNNTIVSICDPEGNVLAWASGGTVGFDAFTAPARDLEAMAKQGQSHAIPPAVAELRELARRIVIPGAATV